MSGYIYDPVFNDLAENIHTPVDILFELFEINSVFLDWRLAENKTSTTLLLEKLFKRTNNQTVMEKLAENNFTPRSILVEMANNDLYPYAAEKARINLLKYKKSFLDNCSICLEGLKGLL